MRPAAGRAAGLAAALLRSRWFVRAPILLFRVRLGWLFGSRLVLLEHTGRVSGERRLVVLEVVARPTTSTYVVASGFGTRAQWYRNVVACPQVRVTAGRRVSAPALARPLDPDQTRSAIRAYAHDHPRAWSALRPVFESALGASIDDDGTTLPLVAIDVCAGPPGHHHDMEDTR